MVKSTVKIHPYQQYLVDQAQFGDQQTGSYLGLKWKALRPNEHLKHWCGYVELPRTLSEQEYERLEELSHGELTGGAENMPGFDCAHFGDFVPGYYESLVSQKFFVSKYSRVGIYRDFPYVRSVLFRMIDYLADLDWEKYKWALIRALYGHDDEKLYRIIGV